MTSETPSRDVPDFCSPHTMSPPVAKVWICDRLLFYACNRFRDGIPKMQSTFLAVGPSSSTAIPQCRGNMTSTIPVLGPGRSCLCTATFGPCSHLCPMNILALSLQLGSQRGHQLLHKSPFLGHLFVSLPGEAN